MNYSSQYWDLKWTDIITQMPDGGPYKYPLRQHNYNIIKDCIPDGSRIFDFACGLGLIDIQLHREKSVSVSGCDFSQVAVNYVNGQIGGRSFRKTDKFFGMGYDFVLAIHFIEHLTDPVAWLKEAFKYGKSVIMTIPNNFRCNNEHVDQQWKSWDEFYDLFKDFHLERIDEGQYPDECVGDFSPPVFWVRK